LAFQKKSFALEHPKIAELWDKKKNLPLTPESVTSGSNKKVWWRCPVAKDHVYQMAVYNKAKMGQGCPFCSGNKVAVSTSLATTHPTLSKLWHPNKNGDLIPFKVTQGSGKKVWWICNEAKDHQYQMVISNKVLQKQGCPMCAGKIVVKSNCLATTHKELAKQWHPTKNGRVTPNLVVAGTSRKVWWLCPEAKDHVWQNSPASRSRQKGNCPFCDKKYLVRSNSLAVTNPELAKEWHPTKNGKRTPFDIVDGSHTKVWWKCSMGDDHEWEVAVAQRKKHGCPICSGRKVVKSTSLAFLNPILSKEWHNALNKDLTPNKVTANNKKRVWWKCHKVPVACGKTHWFTDFFAVNCKQVLLEFLYVFSPQISDQHMWLFD